MLFQSAAVAYICGFHREAVSSAATALERFFEFACHVFWDHLEITADERGRTWKRMAAQSERQLGAFLALYPVVLGESFPWKRLKMQDHTKFRNDVVHKGIIPTRNETEDYLRAIYEIIEETTERLTRTCKNALLRTRLRSTGESQKAARKLTSQPVASSDFDFILSQTRVTPSRDFRERLRELREVLSLYIHVPLPEA